MDLFAGIVGSQGSSNPSYVVPTDPVTEKAGLIEAGKYTPTLKLYLSLARVTGRGLDDLFWIEED